MVPTLERAGVEVAALGRAGGELQAHGRHGRLSAVTLDGRRIARRARDGRARANPRTRCSRRRARASSTSRARSLRAGRLATGRRGHRHRRGRWAAALARRCLRWRWRQVLRLRLRGRYDKDLKRAIAEGFDSIELAKRYTTVTMGPCQGKLCHLNSIRLLARELGTERGRDRHDDGTPAVGSGRARPARRAPPRARRSARRSTAATSSWARR